MSTAVQQAPVSMGPTQSQLAVAYSVCRGIARSAAKNFYYAFLVLPKPKRQALCAVYAFMRRCDDIADDPGFTPRERRQKMADWVEAVHRATGGHPTDDPVLMALTDSQRRYSIPLELLDKLAHGTTMDVPEAPVDEEGNALPLPPLAVQYKTFQDLYQYCYHVASVVGLVCIRVFGYSDPFAEPLAEQVGLAFQLTNIIRDVKEDAALGRIYLPADDMAKLGITAGDLVSSPDVARLKPLLEMEVNRAREYYHAGEKLIPLVDEDSQPGLWVLITIYRRLLEKIAARQYDVFTTRISLTRREKLTILGKGFLKRLA